MSYYELKGCKEGQHNSICGDIFCKMRNEFCKFIKVCPLGYSKEQVKK